MIVAIFNRERLVKLLGMLGSAHGGEIAAAGRAADRLRREAGMAWHKIIAPVLPPPCNDAIIDQIDFVLAFPDAVNEWKRRFVLSLARRRLTPTDKQLAILRE